MDKWVEYLPLPKHLEEIRHEEKLFALRDSRDGIERHQNQPGVGMLFLESFQTSFVSGPDFLHHKMLEGMAIFDGASL